jgi:predicted Rossmann fold flavoprotein
MQKKYDTIVIGAGASGMMCAATAGYKGQSVLVLDHAKRPGKKILISGGGRCNFTNYEVEPSKFLSENPHFCKSALAQYTQWDFIALVQKYGIVFHEKTLGQLFCDDSAKQIVSMLLEECNLAGVSMAFNETVTGVNRSEDGSFNIETSTQSFTSQNLVIATGGLSMPKLGATPFAYKIAEQFGLRIVPPRAGLVPFTLHPEDKDLLASLAGVSVAVVATTANQSFKESMLFTHRGLSGPSILQTSSYWREGDSVSIDLMHNYDIEREFKNYRSQHGDKELKTLLAQWLPKSLVDALIASQSYQSKKIKQLDHKEWGALTERLKAWQIKPAGTEGYRTAEVTLGGVDTATLDSKTMMVKSVPNLYFIGEAVDVTGWLGGYNFQWAWSSGWVAGQSVIA